MIRSFAKSWMTFLAAGLALGTLVPAVLSAQARLDEVVALEIIDGGLRSDGTYSAALHLTMQPGWKTYWRAPGDAGIPPSFSWQGSRNVGGVDVIWPAPEVIEQGGLRSIGYHDELVLPLRIEPGKAGRPVRLRGELDFGVCKDICVPARLGFDRKLDPDAPRSTAIAAALAQRPYSAAEAGVRKAVCTVSATSDGLRIEARIDMPSTGRGEVVVFEPANPSVWASEAKSRRAGGTLLARSDLVHATGGAFALDRSALRITVLGGGQAVEIDGCAPG